jgi:uncharacterized protein (DUF2252 family)
VQSSNGTKVAALCGQQERPQELEVWSVFIRQRRELHDVRKKRINESNHSGVRKPILGPTVEERMCEGKELREKVPRNSHAKWTVESGKRDCLAVLKQDDQKRLPELLPIRYGRMCQSPFAFFRGAAALMARDLAETPVTHIHVQTCGDCHAANFGGFGSPERNLVFDINDFDETLPGPWEWDVKRLAASAVLAGRDRGDKDRDCAEAARSVVESYRLHLREYSNMRPLDAWYSHLDASILIENAKSNAAKDDWRNMEGKARLHTSEHMFPKITEMLKGRRRIDDRPPLVYHPRQTAKFEQEVTDIFHRYRETLPEDRRVILDHYHIADIAQKVVGVGSVGTRCAVALMMASEHDVLFLQLKEARASVLEPYVGKSRYRNHGERVVTGQRMLQAASDVFLGWTRDDHGRDFYMRQLRDMRMRIDIVELSRSEWREYADTCGWALARAHSRTGDAARISGYLGRSGKFDEAIKEFAVEYAQQTERDYEILKKAVKAGKVQARLDVAS